MYLEGTKNGSFLIQKWWNLFQRQSTKNTVWCRWGIHSSMGWVSINLHNHSENTAAFRKALGCVGCFWWQAHSAPVLSCSSRHTGEAEQSCVCPAWRRKGGWDLLLSTIYSWLHGMQRGRYLHEEKLSLVIRKKKSQWEVAVLKKLLSKAVQSVPLEIFRMELEKAFLWLGNYLLWEGAWAIQPERPFQT